MKIPIRYFAERGIQEEKAEDFKDSFFSDVYRQAFDAIASVIQKGRIKNRGTEIDAFAYDVQNTVAFMGRRGTGKTSAMLSVFNALQSNRRTDLSFCLPMTERIINSTEFVALPRVIDASHLEESEDLLEVILACMLKEIVKKTEDKSFDETVYGDKAADLQNRIATMQNHYDSLLASKDHSVPTSYMQLRKSAEKHNIQNAFYRIIEDYLSLMACGRSADSSIGVSGRRIFVICVDDIDMYPGDPMQIMQCIYRYFTLPNLLVLTSMNYNLLYQYIYRHYSDRLKDTLVQNNSDRERLCREQSNDYLSKIIPLDLRIVMPSWRKSDYRDICTKTVQLMDHEQFLGRKGGEPGIDALFPRLKPGRVYNNLLRLSKSINKKDRELSVKLLLFQMLADRLGIYLNANGYKHHFMEPEGLRSTFELFDTLYLMQNFRSESNHNSSKYSDPKNHNMIRENYKIILDTFYSKMLPDLKLDDEETKLFTEFCEITPSRRVKFIIDKDVEKRRAARIPRSSGNSDYSIGELFRVIYRASRESVFSKSFVKAILASFSFILPYYWDEGMFAYYDTMSWFNALEEPDIKEKEKTNGTLHPFKSSKIQTLFDIFGGSLLGNWTEDMFGGELHAVLDAEKMTLSFEDAIHEFLRILMFIRIEDLKEASELSISRNHEDGNRKNRFELQYNSDPTAFIINVIRIDVFCNTIESLMIKEINDPETAEKVKQAIRSFAAVFSEFTEPKFKDDGTWDEYYPLLPFPIHQVDLAYSVVKRALRDIVYTSDNTLVSKSEPETSEEAAETIRRFYKKCLDELNEAQECYPIYGLSQSGELKNHCVFAKRFAVCGQKLEIWKNVGSDEEVALDEIMKMEYLDWHIAKTNMYQEAKDTEDHKGVLKEMVDYLLSRSDAQKPEPPTRKNPRNPSKKKAD